MTTTEEYRLNLRQTAYWGLITALLLVIYVFLSAFGSQKPSIRPEQEAPIVAYVFTYLTVLLGTAFPFLAVMAYMVAVIDLMMTTMRLKYVLLLLVGISTTFNLLGALTIYIMTTSQFPALSLEDLSNLIGLLYSTANWLMGWVLLILGWHMRKNSVWGVGITYVTLFGGGLGVFGGAWMETSFGDFIGFLLIPVWVILTSARLYLLGVTPSRGDSQTV